MKRRDVFPLLLPWLAGCNTNTDQNQETEKQSPTSGQSESSTSNQENPEYRIEEIHSLHYGRSRAYELSHNSFVEETSAKTLKIIGSVSNTGETTTTYQMKLRVNDDVVGTRERKLGDGQTASKSFTVEFDDIGEKRISLSESAEHTVEIVEADTSWPMTGQSNTNNRDITRDSGPISTDVRRRWEIRPSNGPFRGEPVVSPELGSAFVGDSENLYSIDVSTGEINWTKTEADARGIKYIVIHDDELIYTVRGGEEYGPTKLKAVPLGGGETRWEISPENSTWGVYGRPIVTDSRIVVPGYSTTNIYSRDAREKIDSLPRKGRGLTAERDGVLYLPSGETLVKYDMEQREILWEHNAETEGGKISAPLVYDNYVIFGTTEAEMGSGNDDSTGNDDNNTALFVIDDEDGSRVFLDNDYRNKKLTVAGIRSPPLLTAGRLIGLSHDPRTFRAYSLREGMDDLRLIFENHELGTFYDSTASNGVIYILHYDRVLAVDLGGTVVWSHSIDPDYQRPSAVSVGGPVVTEGKLLVAQGGIMICLEAAE